MDVISDIRAALTAACAVVREGLAADAVAGIVPAFVASPALKARAASWLASSVSADDAGSAAAALDARPDITPIARSITGRLGRMPSAR